MKEIKPKYQKPFEYAFNDTAMDAWGRSKTYQDYSIFHGMFTFNVPDSLWKIYENGTPLLDNDSSTKVISVNGKCEIHSGDTHAVLMSRRHPRYQPNRGHLYSTALFLPNPTGSAIRDFGLMTSENGVFFRLKSDGLYACLRSGSILKKEEKITLNFPVDFSKGNIYDIQFQWRGVGDYFFYMENTQTRRIELVHKFEFAGELDDELSIENPALPVCFESTSLDTNDYKISLGCVDVTSEGGRKESLVYGSVTSPTDGIRLGTGQNVGVLALKVNETFLGKINTRDIELKRFIASCNNEAIMNIYITNDQSAFTGTNWTNVKQNSDNLQYAYGGNVGDLVFNNTAYTKSLISLRLEQDQPKELSNPSVGESGAFYLTAADYVVITIDASSSNIFWGSIEWGEEV